MKSACLLFSFCDLRGGRPTEKRRLITLVSPRGKHKMKIGGTARINTDDIFGKELAALGALLNKRENYGQVADLTWLHV